MRWTVDSLISRVAELELQLKTTQDDSVNPFDLRKDPGRHDDFEMLLGARTSLVERLRRVTADAEKALETRAKDDGRCLIDSETLRELIQVMRAHLL